MMPQLHVEEGEFAFEEEYAVVLVAHSARRSAVQMDFDATLRHCAAVVVYGCVSAQAKLVLLTQVAYMKERKAAKSHPHVVQMMEFEEEYLVENLPALELD